MNGNIQELLTTEVFKLVIALGLEVPPHRVAAALQANADLIKKVYLAISPECVGEFEGLVEESRGYLCDPPVGRPN